MAVYLGGSKNTLAVRTAMKITWASINIINPQKSDSILRTTTQSAMRLAWIRVLCSWPMPECAAQKILLGWSGRKLRSEIVGFARRLRVHYGSGLQRP